VRNGTKVAFSVLSLGLLSLTYTAGQANASSSSLNLAGGPLPSQPSSATPSAAPSASAQASQSAQPSQSASASTSSTGSAGNSGSGSKPQPSSSAAPSASGTPSPSASPSATPTQSAQATVVKQSASVSYQEPHSGMLRVNLVVTKTDGKITAVDTSGSTATAGRQQAFSYLASYAVQYQGSAFGNIGGATYTTDAFKQALDAALAKF
jgi:uncharacterized protein with FMN-binding domain